MVSLVKSIEHPIKSRLYLIVVFSPLSVILKAKELILMNIDWSLTIAIIALCVSVLSPVLTTLVENLFKLKLSNREYYEKHRAEVIEGYLRTAGACTTLNSQTNKSEYGKYYAEIFFYAPEPLWKEIETFHEMIVSGSGLGAYAQLIKISKALSDSSPRSPRSKKKKRNSKV